MTPALHLRQYQEEGRDFLASRKRALLADDMGIGKTAQAICAIQRLFFTSEVRTRALIVCPATLRLNWQSEIRLWWPKITSAVAYDGFPYSGSIVIVSYNMLKQFHVPLRQEKWHVVVADEAHYLQSLDSQRTIELRGGWGKSPIPCEYRWALTGTPLQNRPINLYPILKWLEAPFALKEAQFGNRYCGGEAQNYRGATHIDELNEKLKTVMLRRTKAQVLGELPPKTRQIIELNIDKDTEKAMRTEEKAALAEAGVSFEDVVASLNRPNIDLLDKGVVARIRRNTGVAKVTAAAAYIIERMEESEGKILVAAHHADVIDGLRREFEAYFEKKDLDEAEFPNIGHYPDCTAVIDGDTSMTKRHEIVARFQNSQNELQILIGQIEAAGVGLTLTAATLVIFVEQDWVPGKNSQFEDRAHRLGTTENVLVQYLILNGTLDAHIARSNVAKQAVLDAVLA